MKKLTITCNVDGLDVTRRDIAIDENALPETGWQVQTKAEEMYRDVLHYISPETFQAYHANPERMDFWSHRAKVNEEAVSIAQYRGFIGGLKAAAAALRNVLRTKVTVGVINETVATGLMAGVSREINEAMEKVQNGNQHQAVSQGAASQEAGRAAGGENPGEEARGSEEVKEPVTA